MVPFMFDELSAIFKKLVMQLTVHDQLLACWMINGRKIKNQLEPGLVDIGAGTKAVLASLQVAAEKKIVSIRMQTNYHQNPH